MTIPELLSPAGSYDGLVSAIQSGADAVYLGLNEYSARKSAANFSLEELRRGLFYAHMREVKVYLTLNTLVTDDELPKVIKLAKEADKLGVDAFILQDMGLISLLRNEIGAQMHASTQMTVVNKEGAEVLAKLGFTRVVPARELSLAEIKEIVDSKQGEVEVFCHGALCMSYSGQCMMSKFIGSGTQNERSGNRGSCAQPCRMKYALELKNGENLTTYASGCRLSPADLCSLPYLEKLVYTGVHSLKIEGRLKRPEYASLVTKKYRYALDAIKSGVHLGDISKDLYDLSTQFSRGGFSSGHQLGKMPLSAITFQSPGHSGALCGKILSEPSKLNSPVPIYSVRISALGEIKKGDSIIIGRRNSAESANSGNVNLISRSINGKNLTRIDSCQRGDEVVLTISGQIGNAKPGTYIFRTQDGSLTEELSKLYTQEANDKKVSIKAFFRGKIGEKAMLKLYDSLGNESVSYSENPLEKAENMPLSCEKIQKQLEKLGNTPFILEKCEFDIDDIFLPMSVINEMRRTSAEKLMEIKGGTVRL